ncbi:guanosine-5'-triphosphate,3'-diphosphate pyrophosphatase [Thalassotalea atypica]|uniref:Ppx/GppA phosphatase family protein n=1 Tax=Thalassotalea atypica TaxID=2054316 RepID=UPI0025733E84|nr:guanosine-5'-triphosphate,3'-diphosphate pyrophosphatase [Thalassotalea atypica]
MSVDNQYSASPLYAVIDLGSNSFHMLITRLIADGVQTVDKVKRKVRIASGLDENNVLSEQAMQRGLECLSFFAERLQDISPTNIRVVATATIRIAANGDEFLRRAQQILGHKVTLLSGEQEAQRIYLGVAHTSESAARRLVLDIGGASTEVAVGGEFELDRAISLNMGCVTFNQQFFSDHKLTEENFDNAIAQAKSQLQPITAEFLTLGWVDTVGGSGTMQALSEVLMYRNQPAILTLAFLEQLKEDLIACLTIESIDIDGLSSERTPVIASGLAILIALFESFDIGQLQLSSGALREGLLYEMLPDMRKVNIRQRTIVSLSQRFHIDIEHANRVKKQALYLFQQHAEQWSFEPRKFEKIITATCALHEIGLLLSFKNHAHHGAYILKHADMPGFDQAERQLIVTLINFYKGDVEIDALEHLSLVSYRQATQLLLIIRLAVILCRRRRDDVLATYQTKITKKSIALCLDRRWLKLHPLIADELISENQQLSKLGYSLTIEC